MGFEDLIPRPIRRAAAGSNKAQFDRDNPTNDTNGFGWDDVTRPLRRAAAGSHKTEFDRQEAARQGKKPERAESTSSSSKLSPERQLRRDKMIAAAQRNIDNRKATRKAEAKASPVKREAMRSKRYAVASADKGVQAERQRRQSMHQYKGKYWGPDEFKGNQDMIDAWKAKGKPNKTAFAAAYKKK